MKYLFLLVFFFFGCSTDNKDFDENDKKIFSIDSVILESQKNLASLDSTNRNTDSLISGKVKNAIEKIAFLKGEIESYKIEKTKISNVEKIVYRTDTVYIETKKNFWGKEKTTKSIKSDSLITMTSDLDTLLTQKIDSTKF